MSRAETTAMLSKLVEKRLKNQTAFWASEVNFDRNTPDERRVDYVGFKPWNINGEPVPASVEKGCFEFYEVKSCMPALHHATSGSNLDGIQRHHKRRLNEMGYFQIPVSWYRDETMLELMRKSPASIGLYVMMISWCSDNRSYGDIPYTVIRYVLDGEDDELQAIIDAGFLTKTDKVRLREPVYHIKSFRRFDPRSREPISKKLRKAVYERDHYRCVECGATDHLSLDHIIPWSLGGEDTMENLQTMCRSCNSRKGNRLDVVQGG